MAEQRFPAGYPVLYTNLNLSPGIVEAVVLDQGKNNLYRIKLSETCLFIDPQTGETFQKEAGEVMYALADQLTKDDTSYPYIVIYRSTDYYSFHLEQKLRNLAKTRSWHFFLGGIKGTDFEGSDYDLPFINTSWGSFIGCQAIEKFLADHITD